MSYGRRRGLRPVSPYVIVLALAVALTASFFLPLRAEAAISDHTVPTTSPSGTTINLFDYWVNSEDHLSVSGSDGINKDHRFQFKDQGASDDLNRYTGGSSPRFGIVNNVLTGGYPKLTNSWDGESLGYLFDSSIQTGKISHMGVTGLLQVKGGYYEYDSSQNYAAYNANKNAFDVYDAPGVKQAGAEPHTVGQFFPFDAANEVFKEGSSGLVPNGITSQNVGDSQYNDGNPLNHYFGLSMSTRFVQPKSGLANGKDAMTFEFAGDDDVWVFIDDVLVGDIGGIHTRAELTINFQTGEITVNSSANGTLRSKFQAAGKGGSAENWNSNTFADGTNHTLKFFYLERGATDSNMKLKFNLVTVPESDIIKFDQDGKFVQGAEFKLYKTDKDFQTEGKLLGSGTTDETGRLTLTNDDDNGVINFDDLYNKGHDNKCYLLKETKVPEGHRSSLTATDGSMQFEYVPASDENVASGVIINRGGMDADSSVWQSGAFAGSKETITAPSTVYKASDDLTKSDEIVRLDSGGILFAVVLKRDKSASTDIKDQSNWHAVSGDPSTGGGYTLAKEPSMAGAIEAAKKDLHAFTLNTSGQYQVEIPYLPGDISKYYYLLSGDARKDAEYTVAIYHTTASSIGDATPENTVHVYSDDIVDGTNFKRRFATRLLVTNIQNRLFVQKTDTEGNPVDGATFGLYKATTDANGKVVPKDDQGPYDTLTTGSVDNPVRLEGAGIFPCTSDSSMPLEKGTYFLKEVSAPKGFLLNDTLTKVIVDDYGVHADAGTADDGVSTFAGPGTLMKSLGQFGAEGDIDNTLTWIKGMRQTSDGVTDDHGNLSWSNVNPAGAGDTVHLKYGANGRIYQYGPTKAGEPYRLETETGWIRMGITQDVPGDTNAKVARADLGGMNLNALFTGATCVRVANKREASLEVTKRVVVPAGLTGKPDAGFTFKFTVPTTAGKTYKAAVFENAGTASEKQVGKMFDLENGREQTITAGQTIRVYGLAVGDKYEVQELTDAGKMPGGFTLTGREKGGNALSGEGDSISGTIAKKNADGTVAAANNKLVFTNTYSVKPPVTLTNAFWAQKVLRGRDWKDGDSFKIYLRADKGTPMPAGAKDAPVSGMKQVVKTVKNGDKFNFGNIEYAKPGTYTYLIAEATPSQNDADWLPGFGYSSASYRVTVTVRDNGDGTLSQPVVKMEQTYTDDGMSHEDNPIEVADKIAKITNTYNTDEETISFNVQKTYADQSGANPLVKDKFTFQLEALGGMKNDAVPSGAIDFGKLATSYSVGASKVPMPKGCTSTTTTAKNDDGGIAAFPQITYTMGSENLTYVYKVTEIDKSDASTSDGMNYDDTVYYVLVKNQQVDNESGTGKCLSSTVTYWKADGTQLTDANGYIPFKNTYTVTQATSAPVNVQKTFTGRAWETSDAFDFTLTPADDATRDAVKNKVVTQRKATDSDETGDLTTKVEIAGAGDATRSATFGAGDLVFTKSGTYTFNVNETKPTDADKTGIAYDGHTSTVTYTVTDIENGKHTGKLTASVAYDNKQATTDADRQVTDAAAFTNIYAASGTYAGIDVTKTLVGTPLKNGMFPFTIEAMTYNGTTAPEPADTDKSFKNTVGKDDGDDTQTATMSGKLKMNFTQLSYNKVYVYKVSEAHGANAGGYTYDTEYPGDAYVLIAVKPNLDNEGQLYTETTVVKGPDVTALVGEDGDVDKLTAEAIKGLDTTTNYVQTVLSRGAKPATPIVPFKNEYQPAGTSVALTAKKAYVKSDSTPAALKDGEFAFGLYKGDLTADQLQSKQPIQTATNAADGAVTFPAIDYTKAGKYKYTIAEQKGSLSHVTYDATVHHAVVTIVDNAGKLEASVTYDDGKTDDPTFKNTYTAKGSVELTATKVVAVAPGFTHDTKLKGGEYTFELKDADGKVLDTTTNKADGTVKFTRDFKLSDLGGAASKDFTYTIVEQPGAEPGMVYDNHPLTYKVTVADGGNGALNAKAIVTSTSGPETFTNIYQPAATGLALGAQKSYVKKDDNTPIVLKGGEFTFDVYEGNLTAEQLAGDRPVRTATNDANGSVGFGAFSYAKPGTHEYTIVERKGDLAYVNYDAAVHHAVVTVADNAGTLQASVAYDGTDATKPTFTNTYEARATDSGAIALTKSVNVHDGSYQLKAGDFAFELMGSDGSVVQTQKNDADGKVAFDKLTFDHAGTFTYTVREVQPTDDAPGVPGVTYTGKTYTLNYVVKDNNDGKLVVESSTANPSEGTENVVSPGTMTFTNGYQPGQTSYQISGTKVLKNADPATTRTPADGEFTFALIDVATGQEIDRTTNVGNAFTFKAISYTATGSHAYQVKEVAGQDGTITYSDAVLDVKVSVTDDGSGQLTAAANKTAADLTFTNTYTPTATTATITGTKALAGRNLAEGEFSFDLKDSDGNVVQTVQNGADGTFGFAPLQLDKVGTYVYTLSERAGATANGVTYDTTVFTATVTVTENAETHALETQVAYSKGGKAADAVAFSNSYAPAATEVKLGASKVLSGEDLKEGQFSFQLKDTDGKVLQTVKNAADGTVGFEAISYDKPGTYTYSISEVDDGQKNVTYDATEHQVTVTVTDDGAGHLVATVAYGGDVAPVFKNTYTPPTTPPVNPPTNPPSKPPVPKKEKPGLPEMGDTSLSPMALGGIAGGAVVLIAAGVILRRRNR